MRLRASGPEYRLARGLSLIRRRPAIRVRLPRVVYPGSECIAEVVLDARRAVPIEALDVQLVGSEHGVLAGHPRQLELLRLGAQLSGPRWLPRGETRLSCRFALPESLPPSYTGISASTRYTIVVHADIPWWPDARGEFIVHVGRKPEAGHAAPKPALYSSNPTGPSGREPYVEVSLADRVVSTGGSLRGAIALGNVAYNEYTGVELSLLPVQTVVLGRLREETRGVPQTARLSMDAPVDGASIPFKLRIPDVPPTDRSRLWRLDWRLQASVQRRYGRDLVIEVPIEILPGNARPGAPEAPAPPTLGNARVDAVWRHAAQAVGMQFDGEALVARNGDVGARVWREHLGRRGMRLFARLDYPSLRLGLAGGPRAGLRRLARDDRPGQSSWERRHYVSGREPAQCLALWRALLDPVLERPWLAGVRLASLSDEQLVLERRDSGQNEPPLRTLASLVLALASALPVARRSIPAPAVMATAEPAWRELAERLGGSLDTGCMAIACRVDDQPAEIVNEWEAHGPARHTRITLRPLPALGRHWGLEWSPTAGITSGDFESLPDDARRVLERIRTEARAISVRPDELCILTPPILGDPAPAHQLLMRLAELVDALRARTAPYR